MTRAGITYIGTRKRVHYEKGLFIGGISINSSRISRIAIGPAPHRVSRALRVRKPGRVRNESRKSTPGQGPKSAPESQKSPKRRDSRALSLGTLGALAGGTLSGLFSDSSGVPGPKSWGDPVWGGANRNSRISRKWTFLKRPPFQKNPFSQPEYRAKFYTPPPPPIPE